MSQRTDGNRLRTVRPSSFQFLIVAQEASRKWHRSTNDLASRRCRNNFRDQIGMDIRGSEAEPEECRQV